MLNKLHTPDIHQNIDRVFGNVFNRPVAKVAIALTGLAGSATAIENALPSDALAQRKPYEMLDEPSATNTQSSEAPTCDNYAPARPSKIISEGRGNRPDIIKIYSSVADAPGCDEALGDMLTDPVRQTKRGGNTLMYNLYSVCNPHDGSNAGPNEKFQLSKDGNGIDISFDSEPFEYCDEIAKETTIKFETAVGDDKDGPFKAVGDMVIYVNGEREKIAQYMSPKNEKKFIRKSITIGNMGKLCTSGGKHNNYVQLEMTSQIKAAPKKAKKFQSPKYATGFAKLPNYSASRKWTKYAKNVC